MSFDLEVYGEHSLSPDQIAEVVLSVGGLVAEWDAERTSVTAVRHADSERHCLTLDGPFDIEEEDIPAGWQAALSGVTVLYQIHAEVGEDDGWCALAFSRMLASRVAGRVLDPQNDETPGPRSAPPAKPSNHRDSLPASTPAMPLPRRYQSLLLPPQPETLCPIM